MRGRAGKVGMFLGMRLEMKTNFEIKFKTYKDFEEFVYWFGESDRNFDIINAPKSWIKRLNE